MTHHKRQTIHCPSGKVAYPSHQKAEAANHRLNDGEGRVYFAPCCGRYHVTRYSEAEYIQRRATL